MRRKEENCREHVSGREAAINQDKEEPVGPVPHCPVEDGVLIGLSLLM